MGDLLWPGDARAAGTFDDAAVLAAMVQVEQAWLDVLVGLGIAAPATLEVPPPAEVADGAEAGGNPVIPLVAALRRQAVDVHRGLTSQDVLDTALVLCVRTALDRVLADTRRQTAALAGMVREHRHSVMAGRTLTQHAVPVTFGLRAATWLAGLADGVETLQQVYAALPAQVGGAAGTLAAIVELVADRDDPVGAAADAATDLAHRLGLRAAPPWHTRRTAVTGVGDALVALADTWGRIGGDVALLSRPEIGELREAAGGGSSTMPGKANPVLSVLLRRHALAAPGLAATLHTAAASYVDERPDGAWHAEWDTMRILARRSVAAASQAADLLEGLVVEADRMRERAVGAADALTAEQRSMGGAGGEVAAYLGATERIIDEVLERIEQLWNH